MSSRNSLIIDIMSILHNCALHFSLILASHNTYYATLSYGLISKWLIIIALRNYYSHICIPV